MRDVRPILARLNRARAGLESAAQAVPDQFWRKPPRAGAWSAAEVIAHLTMVEGAITDGAIKLLRGTPRAVPLWKRLHLPVWLAEWRIVRRQTPLPLDSSLAADRQVMLDRLAGVRQRTLQLLEQNRNRDLGAYRWPHPFFGNLSFYEWFEVIAHHEVRHTKQIRKIAETYQE